MRLRAWLLRNETAILKGDGFACFKNTGAGDIDLRLCADGKYPTCASGEVGEPTEHENMDKLLSEGYFRCHKPTSNMGGTLSPP